MHAMCVFGCVCVVQYVRLRATHKSSKPYYYFSLHSLQGPHGRHHDGMALEDDDKYMCLGWWHWQWYLKAINHQQHMHSSFTAFIYYIVICYICVYVTVVYVCADDVYELWYVCGITVQVINYVHLIWKNCVLICVSVLVAEYVVFFGVCSNFFFLKYVDIRVVTCKWFFQLQKHRKL